MDVTTPAAASVQYPSPRAETRPPGRSTLISLDNVTRTYKMGGEIVRALDDVSIDIGRGDFVAILGPSGSGKSTLANIIGGLDRPNSGKVTVAGLDLSRARDKKLSAYRSRQVGFVFQSFNLLPQATALENVMTPLVFGQISSRKRKARARECLEAVGLGDRTRHKPRQLSGGQRQRVAIARALANRPSIVIADEPTGNLDSARGAEIMQLLEQLNRDEHVTLLVITHDERVAGRADRVLEIHDGRLTERRT
ncbi:MAG: ABC transporter ATP-binding protein [Actinomycetota bacterium]